MQDLLTPAFVASRTNEKGWKPEMKYANMYSPCSLVKEHAMFESPQYKAIPTHHTFVVFDIDTCAVHS